MMECHLDDGHTIDLMRRYGEDCEVPHLVELIERGFAEGSSQLKGEITRLLSLVYFEGYRNGSNSCCEYCEY
jgi:hypothetical protein